MRRFDEELARLNRRVSDMGDLAETMVSKSCRALIDRVPALMEEVRAAEPRSINVKSRWIRKRSG